ncbi:hypothetical protein V6N13_093352 [Hibiscus sabdariffa]
MAPSMRSGTERCGADSSPTTLDDANANDNELHVTVQQEVGDLEGGYSLREATPMSVEVGELATTSGNHVVLDVAGDMAASMELDVYQESNTLPYSRVQHGWSDVAVGMDPGHTIGHSAHEN